jgi:hypothetical protein
MSPTSYEPSNDALFIRTKYKHVILLIKCLQVYPSLTFLSMFIHLLFLNDLIYFCDTLLHQGYIVTFTEGLTTYHS